MPATAAPPRTGSPDPGGVDSDALSPKQREMLETGLRFVRSSLTMDVQEPTDTVVSQRDAALSELAELERLFGMKPR